MKKHNLQKKSANSMSIFKSKSMPQRARNSQTGNSGHITKFSGDAFKSNKGKGDVIKAGKLEPFSYI